MAQTDILSLARRAILAPGGLDEQRLDRTLGLVMDHAVDAADLYFQVSREESWALEDGIVKEGSASIEEGVGVRAIAGEKTGFAYSDEIQPAALEEASRAARAIAKQSPGRGVQAWQRQNAHSLYLPIDPLASMEDAAKIEWLNRVDRSSFLRARSTAAGDGSISTTSSKALELTSSEIKRASPQPTCKKRRGLCGSCVNWVTMC